MEITHPSCISLFIPVSWITLQPPCNLINLPMHALQYIHTNYTHAYIETKITTEMYTFIVQALPYKRRHSKQEDNNWTTHSVRLKCPLISNTLLYQFDGTLLLCQGQHVCSQPSTWQPLQTPTEIEEKEWLPWCAHVNISQWKPWANITSTLLQNCILL